MSRKRLERKIKCLYPKHPFEKDRSGSREQRSAPILWNHHRKEVQWPNPRIMNPRRGTHISFPHMVTLELTYHTISAGDFLAGLFEKLKGKSAEDLASAFTPESAKDAIVKIKDIRLQIERSGRPEPAESISATLNCPLKDMKSTLKPNEDTSSPLSGSLEVVPLQGNSNYIALSYGWGNESQKLPFILNGHKVEVTENLVIAL
jgi:hypothetical protein